MKKIKKTEIQNKGNFDSTSRLLTIAIAAAVVVLIISVLMFMENASGSIVIKNNSELKLEYVKAYYVDAEGPVNEGIKTEVIEAGNSITLPSEEIDLLYREANLEVRFKFENMDELFVDAGYFNDQFDGKITIDFDQISEEEINLKVKAKNGFLPSQLLDCDEEFMIYLTEGYVD